MINIFKRCFWSKRKFQDLNEIREELKQLEKKGLCVLCGEKKSNVVSHLIYFHNVESENLKFFRVIPTDITECD